MIKYIKSIIKNNKKDIIKCILGNFLFAVMYIGYYKIFDLEVDYLKILGLHLKVNSVIDFAYLIISYLIYIFCSVKIFSDSLDKSVEFIFLRIGKVKWLNANIAVLTSVNAIMHAILFIVVSMVLKVDVSAMLYAFLLKEVLLLLVLTFIYILNEYIFPVIIASMLAVIVSTMIYSSLLLTLNFVICYIILFEIVKNKGVVSHDRM